MPTSPPPAPDSAPARHPGWRRWVIEPVRQQLTQGVAPEKVAQGLAVGSGLALFPILGTTTLLCLAAAVVLRLNQAIVQGVNALCSIIWIPCLIGCVRLGDALTRVRTGGLDIPAMLAVFRHHPAEFFARFGTTALHAVLGWAVAAPFWILACYFLCLPPLRRGARRLARTRAAAVPPDKN